MSLVYSGTKRNHITRVQENGRVRVEAMEVGRGQILWTSVGCDKDFILSYKAVHWRL